MKAVLEFDLRERDEELAHLRCVRNWELALALHSVMEEIRKAVKESRKIDGEKLLADCSEIIQENNINLDELVY
jgi:hypothetical protein